MEAQNNGSVNDIAACQSKLLLPSEKPRVIFILENASLQKGFVRKVIVLKF